MLEQKLIAKVARSFELSLRFLPPQLRRVLTLAYLLARSSDSIADCLAIEQPDSLQALQQLQDYLLQPESHKRTTLLATTGKISPQLQDSNEQALLQALPQLLDEYATLEPAEVRLLQELMQHIIGGQMFDRSHFSLPQQEVPSRPVILEEEQFQYYTYAVAGSVGKFWSELGLLKFSQNYSKLPAKELLELGISFGKGLQQINILRDFHEDLARQRCYLPLPAQLLEQLEPQQLLDQLQPLIDNTRQRLQHGIRYARSLRNWRLRLCCRLPAELGLASLEHMLQQDWLSHKASKVKISRRRLKIVALKCLLCSLFARGC